MINSDTRLVNSCAQCGVAYEFTTEEQRALKKLAPRLGEELLELPHSPLCADCRLQRRYAFRNDWNYYRRQCDLCQNQIVSIYSPDKAYPVYCESCFWSDRWNPLDYGRPFDPSRSFFEQYYELQQCVPRISIFHTFSENSDYSVHSTRNKNCYLVGSVHECENLLYSDLCRSSRDCLDMFSSDYMELCYQCLFSLNCYDSEYLEQCVELRASTLCFDCRSSSSLVGCVGLRAATNQILNQPATPEECARVRAQFLSDPNFAAEFVDQWRRLKQQHLHPPHWQVNAEDCTGNYIRNSVRASNCFNVRFLEDCCLVEDASRSRDCACSAQISASEMLYECHATVESSYSAFSHLIYNCAEMLYCDNCQAGSRNCFGSISLKREQFCVLNKQYSAGDYQALVKQIVGVMRHSGEWGNFFPPQLAPFGYGETKAAVWFPLTKSEVLARGWRWSDYEAPPSPVNKLPVNQLVMGCELPDSIQQVDVEILDSAIRCEVTGRLFRVMPYELDFYQRKGIPLPRRSPWQRHAERVQRSLIRHPITTVCAVCGKEILAYERATEPYPVACGDCYTARLYS